MHFHKGLLPFRVHFYKGLSAFRVHFYKGLSAFHMHFYKGLSAFRVHFCKGLSGGGSGRAKPCASGEAQGLRGNVSLNQACCSARVSQVQQKLRSPQAFSTREQDGQNLCRRWQAAGYAAWARV